jgi:UDP-2,3-diacylglucosamine hydrolase
VILLISDLHLEEQRPDITRAFLQFLQQRATACEALYILGDFFEVWIGDDAISPYQQSIASALRTLSDSGTRIYLMHGNRDFMLGQTFCRQAGCTLLKDPCVVNLQGEAVLLMHGDSLCTTDLAYMRLRKVLRNPLTLWLLRNLPLAKRQQLARKLRNESQVQTRQKAASITDITPAEIPRIMAKYGVRTLIHGHTHRPNTHTLEVNGQAAQRIVLGDWDQQGWALQVDANGYQQAAFEL